jgi:hypothetical protein
MAVDPLTHLIHQVRVQLVDKLRNYPHSPKNGDPYPTSHWQILSASPRNRPAVREIHTHFCRLALPLLHALSDNSCLLGFSGSGRRSS